eukprot:TRINITY_DN6068_c0_g2_i1.p1 TRINITY_DN6068_c0_g2~~TRINITY_DN6068_c0_g2_i1.p1  ORF type:complete len:384 (+),score=46.26 TRINITY_DN6068_c0_g2_i1:33-1184(+)
MALRSATALSRRLSPRRRRHMCTTAKPPLNILSGFPVPRVISDYSTQLREFDEIIDARSPSEFAEDHLPAAINLPVLDDKEREIIGTLHKDNRLQARIDGAALISKNISRFLENHFRKKPADYKPLVYCWRGGQRSQSLALILARIGFKTVVLDGGYRSYRRDLVANMPNKINQFNYNILRGPSGTSKTKILREMSQRGFQVLDLEAMANHKGSVLGSMPNDPQPSQKLFESRLYGQLQRFDPKLPIWLEGEGSKIGAISVPLELIQKLRNAQTILLDVPKSERIKFIIEDYNYVMKDKQELKATLGKLARFVGNELVAQMHELVDQERWEQLVEILLEKHYDPLSKKFLETRLTNLRATIHVPTLASRDVDQLIEKVRGLGS